MSHKKKGVALDASPYGSYEDARARFKHHSLIQDYLELEKETEEKKTKLEVMKQKKLTLLAEVCFLRRRHKHLLEMKGTKPPLGQNLFQPPISRSQYKDTLMEKNSRRKAIKLQSEAPIFEVNMKEISTGAKISLPKVKGSRVNMKEKNKRKVASQSTNPGFDLNQEMDNRCVADEVDFEIPSPLLRLNQKERLFVRKETNFVNKGSVFNVNQMERPCVLGGDVPHRAPAFDLNLISGDEELQDNYGALGSEDLTSINGSEARLNDLKLSICRNMENVPRRSGKRKISWQDPVALKV